jgi:hypothetical protein
MDAEGKGKDPFGGAAEPGWPFLPLLHLIEVVKVILVVGAL